ncbi:hypothetical protein [Virgibacillus halodenitrificans]|uniref:hypothetical protein n=1 Tax=Virgibacillus halodenitrificans TaxID=1482 RepID=UPI001F09FF69|nr:hypothetical protein [Virgibacillus halodenitrificans]
MLLQKLLEQFENISGAEKLGPVASMLLIALWRKAEKLQNQQLISMSSNELMMMTGIRKMSDFTNAINRLVKFGYIRYKYSRGDDIQYYLNFNLYKPFKNPQKDKESVTYKNVMDALEKQYVQLRGSGMFVSPLDYEEMRKVADLNLSLEQATEWLIECFEQYTPKYPADSIRSFKYCTQFIMNKVAVEQAKEGADNHGKSERSDGQTNQTTIRKKARASSVVRRRQEELRKEGFFRDLGDINVNF